MKITEDQIQELYKFTRQHFVEHFDVQTELVDHLANDIEEIWKEKPTISFEQARDISFKKFGVFGFMDVVEARSKSLERKYFKLIWRVFKAFFTIPKLLITSAIFLLIFAAFKTFSTEIVFIAIGLAATPILIFKMFELNKERKKRLAISGKKWLLEDFVFNLGSFGLLFNIFIQFAIHAPQYESIAIKIIVSAILTTFILFTYISLFVLPSKVDEILTKQYPEYKLV
jgi:hypothetical protein